MRQEVRPHLDLARLAARQHGVVSSGQLQRLGYSPSAISRGARAGRLHRLHRGVYAVGHRRLTRHGQCLAAVIACGREGLLSHSSAAWLWGLDRTAQRPPEIAVPRKGKGRVGIRVHHAPALTEEDRAAQDGIPVTALPRTLLDLAAIRPPARIVRAIERAEELRVFDLRPVDALLARTAGHAGHGTLRRALADYREPVFTRSELERRFLALVRRAELPTPTVNCFVAGHELDMFWGRERFAVELDGYEHHGTRQAFERDRLRQEELKLAGIEMIQLTARRVEREPATVVDRLTTLLRRRRSELGKAS